MLLCAQVGAECARSDYAYRTHKQAQSERYKQRYPVFAPLVTVGYHLLQSQHGKQRYGKFGYDKNTCHRAEFVIHREVVDHQVGKPHHIVSPRQGD